MAEDTISDKFGMTWNVHGPTARGTFTASLQQPAYATQPGDEVISASSRALLVPEADAYAEAYIASGGKRPVARGATTVTSSPGKGSSVVGLLVLLALMWAADNKGRR